jgi:hypothetical protein
MVGMIAATHKVELRNQYYVVVDGQVVGKLDGTKETYVVLGTESVARFKRYLNKASAKTLATRWVKFVLARLTVAEVIERLNNPDFNKRVTPMQLAWDLGMPKPSVTTPVSTFPSTSTVGKILFS